MGGDYTRVTFRSTKDYAGVNKQQGRVALDADFNEMGDIVDRRERATTMDIVGRCAVPVSNPDNASAFRITPTGAGAFEIGVGRMYVDGILVECHGRGPYDAFDPSLAESRGSVPVAYSAPAPDGQPYFPAPLPPAVSGAGSTDLVYLDVWRREVTVLEDPALREVALGGSDTTTRWQSVWQVRVLPNVGAASCDDPVAAWDALVTPSAGRLTVDPPVSAATPDPCTVEVAGGYTGLENRLYRVEVHVPGPLGTAQFKWSRDDASLAAAVEAIAVVGPDTRLTVSTIGPDQVQRFRVGDLVEVLDDYVEWRQEAGYLARVTAVDPANRIVSIDGHISGTFDPTDPERHTRLRQWMPAEAGATKAITVTAGPITLDPGVSIRFATDPGGGTFHIGDYWVFAARTIDGTVEQLDAAPPRGIHHHYCRLGLITWGTSPATTTVVDCRPLWTAGEGCCTEIVHPGESIQAALDRLPDAGGCVCLKAGVHEITEPIRITRPGVALHGESPGTIVRRANGSEALLIGDATGAMSVRGIDVHDIAFEVAARGGAVIRMVSAADVALHDSSIATVEAGSSGAGAGVVGVRIEKCERITISRVQMDDVGVGVSAAVCKGLTVEDCLMTAPTIALGSMSLDVGLAGVFLDDGVTAPIRVTGNQLTHFNHGVVVGTDGDGALVANNRVHRTGGIVTPLSSVLPSLTSGAGAPAILTPLGDRAFAVITVAPRCIVADNEILHANAGHGGILVLAGETHVDRNRVRSTLGKPAAGGGGLGAIPIAIVVVQPRKGISMEGVLVRGNLLTGAQQGIWAVGADSEMRALQIRGNEIDSRVPGDVVILQAVLLMDVSDSSIEANQIRQQLVGVTVQGGTAVRVLGNQIDGVSAGVLASAHVRARIAGNAIDGVRLFGVYAADVEQSDIADNSVIAAQEGNQFPIAIAGGQGNRIRGNTVERGLIGVLIESEHDVEVIDCAVSSTRWCGIFAYQVADLRVAACRVQYCGYAPQGFSTGLTSGAGILVALDTSDAVIENCEVLETGISPSGAVQSPTAVVGIGAIATVHWHVHGNIVRGPAGEVAARHTGIAIVLGSDAEFQDNSVSGLGTSALLHVARIVTSSSSSRLDAVICGTNRFTMTTARSDGVAGAAVQIAAQRVSAVGNQVRVSYREIPSFDFTGSTSLSAVGNTTSTGWIGLPPAPNLLPTPHTAFNIIAYP